MAEDEKAASVQGEVVKGTVVLIGRAYDDALKGPMQEVGRALTTTLQTVNVALAPIQGLVWCWKEIEAFVTDAVAKRLKDRPADKVITPDPTIAGPLLENLRFTAQKPLLREAYANLLATAMDADRADAAHPSYVEIVKQMTADEIRIMDLFRRQTVTFAVIDIRSEEKDGHGGYVVVRSFCTFGAAGGVEANGLMPVYLDNLHRLGLLSLEVKGTGRQYVNADAYNELKAHPQVQEWMAGVTTSGRRPVIVHGGVFPTTFGDLFCEACLAEHG